MKHQRALQILVPLIALAIMLTIYINVTNNASIQKLDSASINVLPANVLWEKTYGGIADDRAFYAIPIDDGLLVVGSSKSVRENTTVGWALRLDAEGNVIWNQTFLKGSGTELRYAIKLNNTLLLVGNSFSISGDENGYFAIIDNDGSLILESIVGSERFDKVFSAIATQEGFVLFGLTNPRSANESDVWVVKIDANYNVVWNKTYGGLSDEVARSGVLTDDGNYMIAGYTSPKRSDDYNFMLMKINSSGNLVWNKTYGGNDSEKAYSIAKDADGYVIVGDKQSIGTQADAWIIRVDSNGDSLWEKTVGGKASDTPTFITRSSTGSYLVAGYTFSFGRGERDFWLFNIDGLGQVLWSCTQGTQAFEEAYSVIETGENEFVMAGWADPIGMPDVIGKAKYDFYIVKISANPE